VKKKKDDEDGEGNFDNFVDFRDVPRFSWHDWCGNASENDASD
jgi:hypothetical protein